MSSNNSFFLTPHHVGYLVKNLEKAVLSFESLGYARENETVYDEYRDIYICFMINKTMRVELVQAASEKSVVYDLSKRIGTMPYHICYSVSDVESAGEVLCKSGYMPMGEPMAAPAIEGVPAVFYYNKYIGIIELIEKERFGE